MVLPNKVYLAGDSKLTQIVEAISPVDTDIKVQDATVFPAAPNFATIDLQSGAEVILYNNIDVPNNTLKNCVRGRSYTTAQSWGIGSDIYHSFTADNFNNLANNLDTLNTGVGDVSSIARLSANEIMWTNKNSNPIGEGITTSTDLLTLKSGKTYTSDGAVSTAQNYPFNSAFIHCTIRVMGNDDNASNNGYKVIELFTQNGDLYFNTKRWSSWSGWRKVTATVV